MNRTTKQALIFFSLLVIYTIIKLPYGSYKEILLPKIRNTLASQKLGIDFSDAVLSFPFSWEFTNVKLFFPIKGIPVQLFSEKATSDLSILSLLGLKPKITNNIQLYGGNFKIDFDYPFFSPESSYQINLDNFSLENIQPIKAYGINGKIGFNGQGKLNKTKIDLLSQENAKLLLTINNGSYLGENLYISALKVPQISDLQLTSAAILNKQKLNINSFELNSNLVKASAKGVLHLASNFKIEYASFNIDLSLSAEGKEKLGGYLALASGNDLKNISSNWNIEIEITGKTKPTIKVEPK